MGDKFVTPQFPKPDRPYTKSSFTGDTIKEHNAPTEEKSGTLVRNAGSRKNVFVPNSERDWAMELAREFRDIDPDLLKSVLEIVRRIHTEDPNKTREVVSRIIGLFEALYSRIGNNAKTIQTVIGELEFRLREELKRGVN